MQEQKLQILQLMPYTHLPKLMTTESYILMHINYTRVIKLIFNDYSAKWQFFQTKLPPRHT